MEQVTAPLQPEQETPAEAVPAVVPWVPAEVKPPSHCTGCSVEKTDAPRCEHCGAAIRAGGHVVLRTISQGPHGRVYEALAPNGKRVALKELIFSLVPDAATLDAFQREAELLRAVSHAQIPRMLSAFSEGVGVNTRLYLAQELVEGMSLQEAIGRAPLSTLEARRLARQILRVLQVLHGRDPPMLHRDIKPANLILRPDGVVSLVDFGSARLLARGVTHGATLVGTFGYMPPEQLGGTVDASCDIYALGATLMHALTGKAPEEMTRDGFSLDVDHHLRGLADPGLKRVIRKMVAPNRADRFRSAEEALYALRGTQPVLPARLGALSRRLRALPARLGELSARLGEEVAAWMEGLPARTRGLLVALGVTVGIGLGNVIFDPATFQAPRVPAWSERVTQHQLPPMDRPWWSVSIYGGAQGTVPAGMAGVRVTASRADALILLDGRLVDLRAVTGAEPYPIRPGAHEVRFGLNDGRGSWGVGRFGVSAGQVMLVQGVLMAPVYPPGKDPRYPEGRR